MPSQVAATFIRTLSLSIPSSRYNEIKEIAFLIVPSTSKDRLASTSVETLPGIIFNISFPKFTYIK